MKGEEVKTGREQNRDRVLWWEMTEAQEIKKRKTNDWFPKQESEHGDMHWRCLMRSGKRSSENNLNCSDHGLFSVIKDLFISSSNSVPSGPLLLQQTRTCQGGSVNNWGCRLKTHRPPFSFFCLPIFPPPFFLSVWFPLADTFRPSHVHFWQTYTSSLILHAPTARSLFVTVKLGGGALEPPACLLKHGGEDLLEIQWDHLDLFTLSIPFI